jgi:hypothetical protein
MILNGISLPYVSGYYFTSSETRALSPGGFIGLKGIEKLLNFHYGAFQA